MSAPTTTQRMTAEEFYDFVHRPENDNKWFELVRGEVIELPAPTRPHGFVCLKVGSLLVGYTEAVGNYYVTSNDSGVILERDPDTVRGPDVALYDDANSFEELHPKYGEVRPLLAVEVLSPNDRHGKVMRKVQDYLKAGVRLVWLIDPETRNVTVYRPEKVTYLVEQGQEITGEEVLPNLRLEVAAFFRLPRQRPQTEQPPA